MYSITVSYNGRRFIVALSPSLGEAKARAAYELKRRNQQYLRGPHPVVEIWQLVEECENDHKDAV